MESGAPLGERIAFLRRRRGLSQVEFAALVGRSESWVSQVERGTRAIDRRSVLAQVAEVLGVPVGDLVPGEPSAEDAAVHPVDELVLALTGHPALASVAGSVDAASAGRPVDVLGAHVDLAWDRADRAEYGELARLLAGLLGELEAAARGGGTGRARRPVFELLAKAYQAAAAMLAKAGRVDAAWIAADRALFAAERAGSPLLVVAGHYRMGQVFLSMRRFDQARRVAEAGAEAVAGRGGKRPKEASALLGALHLVMAVTASRQGDRAVARQHLDQAAAVADEVGEGRNDFDLEFGPTNVRLHRVAVAVELGDAGEALEEAERVDASSLSPERQARFLIDVARAHNQRRRVAEAVRCLLEAEQLTPEHVHDHPAARDVVHDLLQREGRRPSDDVRKLAERMGLAT